ncbi:MAG: aldo/keto reductase [Eubacteriales bacterium]|nr:aldo/keto reductase [Eubacteriales bacterium]
MDKRIQIPDTDLSLYPLGFGTSDAGLKWDGAEADRLLDAYLSCGGNVIDTAHVYSDWVPGERARSERVIGDWLQRSGKRGEVILMTKGGHPDMTVEHPDLHRSRMSHDDMVKDLEESLRQLRTDCIDLYFYHRDNRNQSVAEEIETMEEFVKAGKIRYYGCSNWDAERMKEADRYCAEHGYRGFVADQSLLNLGMKFFRGMSDDTLGCIREEAFAYHEERRENLAMPYMGNCGGYFQSYAARGEDGVRGNSYDTPENRRVAEKMMELCRQYGCSVTQAVLAFFYHQPFVCVPLYSASKPERIIEACGALEAPLTDADYEWLLSEE